MEPNSNSVNGTNGARAKSLRKLSLMRSIKLLKDTIDESSEKYREISGILADAQANCRKVEDNLQTLADTNLKLKTELIKLAEAQQPSDSDSSDNEAIDEDGVRLEDSGRPDNPNDIRPVETDN